MRSWAAIASALIAALAPFAACSDGFSGRPGDAGDGADTSTDERRLGDAGPEDSAPDFNTDGWARVDHPNCSFWAAPTPEKMPPPLEWEPCSSSVLPAGLACRQLRDGLATTGWVNGDGKAWLGARLAFKGSSLEVVAEADGGVHQAMTYSPGDCVITSTSLLDHKVIYMAVRPKGQAALEERGAVGGEVDAVPLSLEHWDDGKPRAYRAGGKSYLALGPENAVRPWTPGAPPLGTVALTDPGQIFPSRFVGDELFYEIGNLSYSRIKVYSPASGARDLISFGNDIAANATDFGTDGIDMVWLEAFGRASTSQPWTTINIMTSKFTSEAANVQKRRLRSEKGAIGAVPFTVGCGYAVHDFSSLEEGNGARIVRLSDGHSWRLSQVLVDGGSYFQFQRPHAITCDEVFLAVNDGGASRTVRIRLDSLGPGEPAD